MRMRRLLIIFLLVFSTGLCAQQIPQYSHYVFNKFQINPAVAGSKECLDIRFGYRTQWTGFDNAPRTAFASINGVVGKPSRRSSRNSTKHAIGLALESDNAGPFIRTTVQGAYAYHFPMNRDITGSFGLFAGFTQYRIDLSTIQGDPSVSDPVLAVGSTSNLLVPDISPGFWMKSETFFLGLSIRHLTGNKIDDSDVRQQALVQHLALTGGKAFPVSKKVNFIPSTLIKYVPAAPLAVDVNAVIDFNRRFALGVGYRSGDAFVGLMKVNFLDYFTLGYAYDYTTSPIRVASSNTHEVTLGITACPFNSSGKNVPCGAYD